MVAQKIFVTGGTGFTGAALVERLLRDGHEVSCLDKKPGLMDEQLQTLGARIHYGSVTDPDKVRQAAGAPDVVMHLAAAFREIGVPDQLYKDVNVCGTRVVAEAALEQGAEKFVYCSTQGVHGHIDNPPGDETSPIAPADYYQQTKYEGEQEVAAVLGGKIDFTTIRPTAIYGPGDPGRFLMIFKRVRKGVFPMFGRGRTFYHPVYIDNLVDAFVRSMQPGVGSGQAYIIGDEAYFSIEELVRRVGLSMGVPVKIPHYPIAPLIVAGHVCEKICKPLGIDPPIFPRRVDWFRQMRAFRIDKAKRDLGYEPAVGIDVGLQRTADWYLEHGYLT